MNRLGQRDCSACGKPLQIKPCGGEYFNTSLLGSVGDVCICDRCGKSLNGAEHDKKQCIISVCVSCGEPLHKIIARRQTSLRS